MGRKSYSERNIRKLTRMGGGRSLGLTIPAEFVYKLNLKERQKVVVKLKGEKMIIEDWKEKV